MQWRGLSCVLLCLAVNGIGAETFPTDERGNIKPVPIPVPPAAEHKLFVGGEAVFTAHNEEGLDSTKGEYSVSYSTLGGSLTAQYHITDFYFEGGLGLMTLMSLKVNNIKMDMANRSQLHLPLYARAYYKLDPLFGIGAGFTHLTEMSMYVDSVKVPQSSYHQIFVDFAAQLTPQISPELLLTFTAIIGLNVIPGRQHTYTVGDLLHLRFQFNAGLLYRVF